MMLSDNILKLNKKLYKSSIKNYYNIFGYEVVIVKPNKTLDDNQYIDDKFKKGYGSLHSSTYTDTSQIIEIKRKIIIPNVKDMTNLYNDTDHNFTIYHSEDELLEIGDIIKISFNNKIYEYKVSNHPLNYYNILYEYRLKSMYIGSN